MELVSVFEISKLSGSIITVVVANHCLECMHKVEV